MAQLLNAAGVMLLLVLAACSGSEPMGEAAIPAATGGLVVVDGLTLAIPPGALTEDQLVTVASLGEAPEAALTPVFLVEPAAVPLTAQALIGLRLPEGAGDNARLVRLREDGGTENLADTVVDAAAREIRGRTLAFGRFVVLRETQPVPGGAHEPLFADDEQTAGTGESPVATSDDIRQDSGPQDTGNAGVAAGTVDAALIGTWRGEGSFAAYLLELDSDRFSIQQNDATVRSGSAAAAMNRIDLIDTNGVHEAGTYDLQGDTFRMRTTSGDITWRRTGAAGGFFTPAGDAGHGIPPVAGIPGAADDAARAAPASGGGFFGNLGSRVKTIGRKAVDTVRSQTARLKGTADSARQQAQDLQTTVESTGRQAESLSDTSASLTDGTPPDYASLTRQLVTGPGNHLTACELFTATETARLLGGDVRTQAYSARSCRHINGQGAFVDINTDYDRGENVGSVARMIELRQCVAETALAHTACSRVLGTSRQRLWLGRGADVVHIDVSGAQDPRSALLSVARQVAARM
ncbi:MAG: hypothetical protein H6993_13560 [Pseudomonadales bacterium]|nr:hypothetical protein [Pseudomonadales bacterium]